MSNKIVSYFPNTSLRYSHDGLSEIAKQGGKDVKNLTEGQFLVFVNSKRNMAKILTTNGIILHVKSLNGSRLSFDALNKLPKYFNGTTFDYSKALKETILKHLEVKGVLK